MRHLHPAYLLPMPASTLRTAGAAARRIETACSSGLPAQELLETVGAEFTGALGAEGLFVAATDPDTMLAMGVGVVRELPDELCQAFWEYEFEVPDYNKFADLARSEKPVADLHASTGGRPERSARHREFTGIIGLEAELRAAFPAGDRSWGLLQINRDHAFTEEEVDFVADLAPMVGRAVRTALLTQPATHGTVRAPGMALFDAGHRLLSITPEAQAWFEEVGVWYTPFMANGDVPLPESVLFAVMGARATAESAADGRTPAVRTRMQARDGSWLAVHASVLREPGGALGPTALVIERAKASEVAPLIVDAYELTPREVEVTQALARGLSTQEIAGELHLSRYTVQDHLKSVYEKTGVSSRGELVARMFADLYQPSLDAAIDQSYGLGPSRAQRR